MGPLSFEEVFDQYGTIFFEDSLAWTDGMDDWCLTTPPSMTICLSLSIATLVPRVGSR